jgi:hypothetical protein
VPAPNADGEPHRGRQGGMLVSAFTAYGTVDSIVRVSGAD